jgi:hypothetical protein
MNIVPDQEFDRLKTVCVVGKHRNRNLMWKCVCRCGNEVVKSSRSLANGHAKSCGCLKSENAVKTSKTRVKSTKTCVGCGAEFLGWPWQKYHDRECWYVFKYKQVDPQICIADPQG